MKRMFFAMLACLACVPVWAQTTKPAPPTGLRTTKPAAPAAKPVVEKNFTNEDVATLLDGNVDESNIILAIKAARNRQQDKFDISGDALNALKNNHHASKNVIACVLGDCEPKPVVVAAPPPPPVVAETKPATVAETKPATTETAKSEDNDKGPIDRMKGLFHRKKNSDDAEVASPAPKASSKPSSDVKDETKRKQAYEFPLTKDQKQAYEQLKRVMQTQIDGMKLNKTDPALLQIVGEKTKESWSEDHTYTTTVQVLDNKVKVTVTKRTIGNHVGRGKSTADKFDLDSTINNGQLLEAALR